MKQVTVLSLLLSFFTLVTAEARVYKNVKVGSYQSVIELADYKGQPFFKTMKDIIYPEINDQAANRQSGSHLNGIKQGEGVEVLLTDDVTTYHVKYKADTEDKVERSGRSFGAIGLGRTKEYVADASYKHYLRTLERALHDDDEKVSDFFRAILMVITDSNPSGFEVLDSDKKQVAADFVAIYIAEQYRRLTATKGKYLGRSHRWDDALVQVTLVSAFHSGQDELMMFYEGKFTGEVFDQDECLYRAKGKEDERKNTAKRSARLYDYWQFTVRSECPGRSGVNLTRRDFEKLGRELTKEINTVSSLEINDLDLDRDYRKNLFKAATDELLKGSFEYESADFTEVLVDVLMTTRSRANEFSKNFAK